MRAQFCNETNRITRRIGKAKENGIYKPNKKYYCWVFYDEMKFIGQACSPKARFHMSFEQDFDSDVEIVEDSNSCQMVDTINSCQTESDSDVEIIDSANLNEIKSEKENPFNTNCESDNDIEIIEANNLDQTKYPQENYLENGPFPRENEYETPIIIVPDSPPEVANFKSYTVAVNSCEEDRDCQTILNDNSSLPSHPAFKEEPEIQIEAENPYASKDITELQDSNTSIKLTARSNSAENVDFLVPATTKLHYEAGSHISSSAGENHDETAAPDDPSTLQENLSSNSDLLKDEDYSFLCSFLSQTKIMTQHQQMELRVNMKNLLVDIFPASASVNILEKQLLLPEDNDPDRKFLISFWPFIKSMSITQNLQFRAKLARLVWQILSTESIL